MKKEELRIGNWVLGGWREPMEPMRVDADHLSIWFGNTNMAQFPKPEPIPITPEILIDCGFKRTGRYAIGAGGYHTFTNGKIEFLEVKKGEPYTLAFYEAKISYLHQLQNLYFSLTGKDLTLSTIIRMKKFKYIWQHRLYRLWLKIRYA